MSKKKKNKEKRADRRYKVPMDYIEALADRIHSTAPTMEILTNTLADLYSVAFAKGYARRMADHKFFKEKQSRRRDEIWKKFLDWLDDQIHPQKETIKR